MPRLTLCILIFSLATPLQAKPTAEKTEVWQRFMEVCTPALTDAQSFVEGLAWWTPAGSHGIAMTPDGKMFRPSIKTTDFEYGFDRFVLKDKDHENCATAFGGDEIVGSKAAAIALEAFAGSFVTSEDMTDGNFPDESIVMYVQIIPGWMSLWADRLIETGN